MTRFRTPEARRTQFALRIVVLVVLVATITPSSFLPEAKAGSAAGWAVRCAFVRHLRDDPIVYPSRPGASHLHAFFGNRSTDADSTLTSLRRGATSCGHADDKAAYWIPAAYSGTTLLTPSLGSFYYRSRTYPASAIRPFPAGLKMIAGSSTAANPQRSQVMYWICEDGGPQAQTSRPVDCGSGYVSVQIKFPDCWDGTHLDSSDHRSHMAYSVDPDDDGRFSCPASRPVPVPRLQYSIDFPLHDGTRLRLSSGAYYTMHADFFNAWTQTELASLVANCLNRQVNCGVFGLGR